MPEGQKITVLRTGPHLNNMNINKQNIFQTTEKVERLRGCYAKDYTCDKYEADLKTLNSAWGKLEIKSCNMKTCDTDKCNGAGSTLIASTLLALPLLLAIVY
eukprot:sb/3478345/